MKKRLLITGAGGFVGSRLCEYYKEQYDVFALTHKQFDFTDRLMVDQVLDQIHPQIVIHSGAVSNTWTCEQNPDLSYEVNVKGSVNMADACSRIGARMIFMSSDQIYNGSLGSHAHKEEEEVHPINVYGKHKLEAEQRILEGGTEAVCLRLSWMFDWPAEGKIMNQSLFLHVLKAIQTGEAIQVPVYEYRGITYVQTVVKEMEKVFSIPKGTYNYGSENGKNTVETVKEIFKALKQNSPNSFIIEDKQRYANAPRNLTMDIQKVQNVGIYFPDTQRGIQNCIQDWRETHII